MKKMIRFACIVSCLLLQTQLFANTVIVKGTVKDSANNAIANRTVKIYSTDSSNHGCLISHTKITNPNGYYIDTLTCNGDIRKLSVIVENCNGVKITHEMVVTPNNIIESNFIICKPNTPTGIVPCKAAFSYTLLPTGVKCKSAGSAGTFAADSIISRTWTFGDRSATLGGNILDPAHAYTKPGVYNVCLSIKTKNGCESKYCSNVVFTPASNDCHVQAVISAEKIGNKIFRFNSAQSSTSLGDSIVQRIWKFGDGFSIDGNQVNPAREYKNTGIYNVCLSVRTVKGCEKQYCLSLVVRDSATHPSPANCKASFTYSTQGTTVKFNAAGSVAPAGDSIISRTWIFGNQTASLTGNRVDPSHQFAKAGTYNVCLYIKTKGGCESNICQNIVVHDSTIIPTGCKAYFNYTILKDSLVVFNSAGSAGSTPSDSIISRTWYYTDITTNVSLTGNIITPSYPYTKPGTYKVTLVIKTKNGCESRYTGTIVIPPKPAPTNCKAYFSFTLQNKTATFNSSNATATSAEDSIISRIWFFGDTATNTALQGNKIDPVHEYRKAGAYHVYLYIKTKSGCESKYESTVVIAPANCTVQAKFNTERIGLKKVQFNSSLSTTAQNDSIVQRTWRFGDNTSLNGNQVSPVKEFSLFGFYNTCLQVRTANGCEAKTCKEIVIQDTVTAPLAPVNYIKIITINPNPVITRMVATVFSRNTNVEAEICIYDIYGNNKLNIKKLLSQGNNFIEIATDLLPHGPYFLKVSTRNGRDSKAFYKL